MNISPPPPNEVSFGGGEYTPLRGAIHTWPVSALNASLESSFQRHNEEQALSSQSSHLRFLLVFIPICMLLLLPVPNSVKHRFLSSLVLWSHSYCCKIQVNQSGTGTSSSLSQRQWRTQSFPLQYNELGKCGLFPNGICHTRQLRCNM